MADHQHISLDIEELDRLLELATRPNVKQLLQREADKLRQGSTASDDLAENNAEQMKISVESTSAAAASASGDSVKPDAATNPPCISVTRLAPQRHYKEITTYAWDQSENFMKLYVTLKGVQKLDKELVKTEYMPKSFSLKVENLDGSNYVCRVAGLWGNIVPDKCYHRVKSDMVLLMLKKEEDSKTWPYVTEREDKKKKPTPKMDEKKDPNEGLMDLLKQMYEDGDDEMKRTIAKSWTESRSKGSSPMDV